MGQARRRTTSRGFTLIELVIVVLVIGILAVLLTPKFRQSVMKAQGADVATRVEAINVAFKSYEADHDSLPVGTEPPGMPSWIAPYMARDFFAGPSNITWQYSKPTPHERAMLIITAGPPDDKQILLAAAAALGSIAAVIGGGSSVIVSMTE